MTSISFVKACEILQINKIYSRKELKHAYHKQCLQYHPDKSKINTNEHFIKINEAYIILSIPLDENDDNENDDNENDDNDDNKFNYRNIISLDFFKKITNLDVFTVTTIYDILFKYQDILHLSPETIYKLKQILINKKVTIIKTFFPTIENIMDCDIFKIEYNKSTYFAPSWHSEVQYKTVEGFISIKCIPILPDHITLDEFNNLHINITYKTTINEILKPVILCEITPTIKLNIHTNKLIINKCVTIEYSHQGFPVIDLNDIYNNLNKSNIYIHIIHILLEYK